MYVRVAPAAAELRRRRRARSMGGADEGRHLRKMAAREKEVPRAFISMEAMPRREASSVTEASDMCTDSTIISSRPAPLVRVCRVGNREQHLAQTLLVSRECT